ncbi:MAG: hypothetical protein ACRDSF_02980 [Pseudonocardiaceae bacterium]
MPASDRRPMVDGLISDLLVDLPGLLIVGPRATGKTTTARRYARSIVHLGRADGGLGCVS